MVWNDFNPRGKQGFLKVGSISLLATILWHPINTSLGRFHYRRIGLGWQRPPCKLQDPELRTRQAGGLGATSWGPNLHLHTDSPSSHWLLRFPTTECANLKPQLGGCQGNHSYCFLVETGSWRVTTGSGATRGMFKGV